VIGHALTEGWELLRRRTVVSAVLAVSLAVPLAMAGFTATLGLWARPLVSLKNERAMVRVLLHPRMDAEQRVSWIDDRTEENPEWSFREVARDELADNLKVWFPYLEDLVEGENRIELPHLVEVTAPVPDEVEKLRDGPAVIAVGPTASIHHVLGRVAESSAWMLGGLSLALLLSAFLLAATWIHLEIFRHADEITIMRLVGATEASIRSPFLFVAGVPGTIAGLLALVSTLYLVRLVANLATAIGLDEPQMPLWIAAAELIAGLVLPVAASAVTLARHARAEDEE